MSKKIKVVLFIDSLVRGGAQRQLVELALNLDRDRFVPTVLIYHDIQQFRPDLDAAGIPVVLISKQGKFDLLFLIRLVMYFRASHPDIVHSYLNTPNFWARMAGKLAGVRYLITSERNIDIHHSSKRVALEKFLARASARVVANAEAIRELLVRKVDMPPEKIEVIYNGVDIAKFTCCNTDRVLALRQDWGILPADFVMVLPGRIVPQKNHKCLIRAIDAMHADKSNLKVVFVGNENDQTLKQELQQLIAELHLTSNFIFAGKQDDMAAVYAAADVIVLPSLWEGFPNVVLEAMAAGKPVIASDIADNRRIVQDGITGYLFPSDSHTELAHCLEKIIDSGDLSRCEMGVAGMELVRSDYSMDKMVKTTQSLYESVLA